MFTFFLCLGSIEKSTPDCRTEECGDNSECIREHAFFVCRCLPGFAGTPDKGCQRGKSSLKGSKKSRFENFIFELFLYLLYFLYTVHKLIYIQLRIIRLSKKIYNHTNLCTDFILFMHVDVELLHYFT